MNTENEQWNKMRVLLYVDSWNGDMVYCAYGHRWRQRQRRYRYWRYVDRRQRKSVIANLVKGLAYLYAAEVGLAIMWNRPEMFDRLYQAITIVNSVRENLEGIRHEDN